MRENGELHVGRAATRLDQREQRQPFDDGMEDEGDERHLGGDAESVHPAAGEKSRSERPRPRLEDPGQRESTRDPDERFRSEARHDFGDQVEGDDARARRRRRRCG